jgi:hypothetical protein
MPAGMESCRKPVVFEKTRTRRAGAGVADAHAAQAATRTTELKSAAVRMAAWGYQPTPRRPEARRGRAAFAIAADEVSASAESWRYDIHLGSKQT